MLLMGPTGSGKSDLALRLAEAAAAWKSSAWIRRWCIAAWTSAPPSRTQPRAPAVPHHLIDIRDPAAELFGGRIHPRRAARHAGHLAARAASAAGRRHHAVLPCAEPRALRSCRKRIPKCARRSTHRPRSRDGRPCIGNSAEVDPAAAARIHVNDPQRIQRALEVYRLTGETITKLQQKRVSVFADVNVTEFALAPLERARVTHQDRIAVRGDARRRIRGRGEEICTKEAI